MKQTEINPEAMRAAAGQASMLLRALANEDRLMLLCQLSQGEACVSALEQACNLFQPSLSQHLGVLRRKGLVDTRRDGKRIFYRVTDDNAMAVLQVLYERFCPRPGGL
ncbi:MAG: metalloregulator ArsR/SmtB family transcription factor [Ketobacter sp.]|uniref:ArsR/SmtB family transcription factor n=1 Tax=Ketobacter sp. MCCC 1A13808 TaxID=2602738 RepID=UPI0018DD095F|nr:metalloregulator ArsR/SmtB family transcription factor [Ketobacter sp. MCCC 1A13808]